MTSFTYKIDFSTLLPAPQKEILLQQLCELISNSNENLSHDISSFERKESLEGFRNQWQKLSSIEAYDNAQQSEDDLERVATDWLILLFNTLFADQDVILAHSEGEPEYFPAQGNQPARIEFAHGFFQSALHEISHWCLAGETRRRLPDFGYWYAADGRSEAQQQSFERVEIKPQSLECLFTLACGRPFQVSQDNLFADFDTSKSTFARDVYVQVEAYIAEPHLIPRDAKVLLKTLLSAYCIN